ncbi:hypothetical protein F2Y49_23745, partial [Bacteroides caccae]
MGCQAFLEGADFFKQGGETFPDFVPYLPSVVLQGGDGQARLLHAQGHSGRQRAVVRAVSLFLQKAGKNAGSDVTDAVEDLAEWFRRFRSAPLGFADFLAELALAQIRQFHDLLKQRVEHAGLDFLSFLF